MSTSGDILTRLNKYSRAMRSGDWKAFASQIRRERGNFCQVCRQTNVELQVHHYAYSEELMNPDDVVVLCRACHEEMHEQLAKFRRFVFRYMTPQSFRVLNGALTVGFNEYDPLELSYAIAEMVSSPGSVKRFFQAWRDTDKSINKD